MGRPALAKPEHWYRLEVRRKVGRGRRVEAVSVLVKVTGEGELQAHLDEYRGRLDGYSKARLHECCKCGAVGPWDENWSWYGSMKDMDDGKPVRMFCSAACRAKGPKGRLIEG